MTVCSSFNLFVCCFASPCPILDDGAIPAVPTVSTHVTPAEESLGNWKPARKVRFAGAYNRLYVYVGLQKYRKAMLEIIPRSAVVQ